MPLASVDAGSNSIRLLIAEVAGDRIIPLRRGRVVTRLAAGLERTGELSGEAMEATLKVLGDYACAARELGARRVKAVGTSALREAANSERFLARVRAETGIDVEIISGDREAGLTARGVLSSMKGGGRSVIIDIGGGSTEWMLCENGRVLLRDTVPVGVVKLLERHPGPDPPSEAALRALDAEARNVAASVRARLGGVAGEGAVLVATAGTATTLAAIDLGLEPYDPERVHMHPLTIGRLEEILERLVSVPLEERRRMKGLEPGRADLIIPGAVLTIRLAGGLGFDRVLISDHGLLEGALLELCEEGKD